MAIQVQGTTVIDDSRNVTNVSIDATSITSGTVATARLPSGSTAASGIIQLTDSTSSTSTTTAATPNSVKVAFDLANGKVAANTAITAGTATKITYDAKGLVTAGASLDAADIPSLDAAKITSGTMASARMPAFSGDATSVAGATALTLANSGVTAGTYPKVTVDAKGRVTAGASLAAADIPSLDAAKITSGTLADARLAGTYSGMTLKIDGSNTVFTTPSSGTSSSDARTVYGLAEYRSTSATQVGAIVFIAPSNAIGIMTQLEVAGLLYNQNIVSMQVQGYRGGATSAWSDLRKVSTGTADIQVRWGVAPNGNACLILGDVATSWSYPHMSIVRAMFSHSGTTDAYCKDWTVAIVTDLSTYTYVSATVADSAVVGSISGNAATATALQTARTIGGVSFNGTANINLPGVNTIGNQSTTGNAATATALQTARAINGTDFNGSAAITTANWGTARTLTIGSTGKSVNGSADVSWTLAEIGAAASSHTHSYLPLAGGALTGAVTTTSTIVVNNTTASTSATTGSLQTTGGLGVGGSVYAAGNVTAYSDERLKTDIELIPNALSKVCSLRGVTYKRIDSGERQTGVIAQEVQNVLPEAVSGDEYLGVAYGNMVGILIEAIKELNAKVESLTDQLNAK
jgi:hypothetical protein